MPWQTYNPSTGSLTTYNGNTASSGVASVTYSTPTVTASAPAPASSSLGSFDQQIMANVYTPPATQTQTSSSQFSSATASPSVMGALVPISQPASSSNPNVPATSVAQPAPGGAITVNPTTTVTNNKLPAALQPAEVAKTTTKAITQTEKTAQELAKQQAINYNLAQTGQTDKTALDFNKLYQQVDKNGKLYVVQPTTGKAGYLPVRDLKAEQLAVSNFQKVFGRVPGKTSAGTALPDGSKDWQLIHNALYGGQQFNQPHPVADKPAGTQVDDGTGKIDQPKYKEVATTDLEQAQQELANAKVQYDSAIEEYDAFNTQTGLTSINIGQQQGIVAPVLSGADANFQKVRAVEKQALETKLTRLEYKKAELYKEVQQYRQDQKDALTTFMNLAIQTGLDKDATSIEMRDTFAKQEALTGVPAGMYLDILDTIYNTKDAQTKLDNQIKLAQLKNLQNPSVQIIGQEWNERSQSMVPVYGYTDPKTGNVMRADGTDYTSSFTKEANTQASPSGNTYDWSTYNAVGSPAQQQAYIRSLQENIASVGKLENSQQLTDYIAKNMQGSKITANEIMSSANKYNIGWEELLGIIKKESIGGRSPVALKNNNYGGITWSATYQASHPNVSKGTARPASEGGNYVKFNTVQDGVDAQAEQIAKRKIATTSPTNVIGQSYAALIRNGQTTFDKIPDKDKAAVAVELAKMGVISKADAAVTNSLQDKKAQIARSIEALTGTFGAGTGVVGPYALGRLTGPFAAAGAQQNFVGDIHQMTDAATLDALLALKKAGGTLGAISEKELSILQNSATKINGWEIKDAQGKGTGVWNIDENNMIKELQRMDKSLNALYGAAANDLGVVDAIRLEVGTDPLKIDMFNKLRNDNPTLSDDDLLQLMQSAK